MRPYLAIIKDSFREAMSNWVLWILLALITLFLIVIAPLGIRQKLTTEYLGGELRDPVAFVALLKGAADKPEPTPAKHIWSILDEKVRADLEKGLAAAEKDKSGNAGFRLMRYLPGVMNGLLSREDLYSAEAWRGVRLNEEARDYVDRGREALDNEERLRMNRVLLEAAFPDQFLPLPQKSLIGTYLVWDAPFALPIEHTSAKALIEEYILSYFLSWIVGSAGVLVAIVVTASIIPQMFEPGALHLLLSKPVNRSILFLSKFIGGCAFTLVNAGYLLAGMYLILGLRFGIWNVGMLYCIPIFLFMFAIYYAVSALASVIWRHAIVSVMVTVVFWAACFSIGTLKIWLFDNWLLKGERLVQLIPAGDSLLAKKESGNVMLWDEEEMTWREIFRAPGGRAGVSATYVGPLYDEKHDQLVGANAIETPLGQIPVQLALGKRNEAWMRRPGVALPGGSGADIFLEPEQNRKESEKDQPGILLVSTNGVFRYADVPRTVIGFDLGLGSALQFVPVGANENLFFNAPIAAAMNADNGQLAVYSRGTVYLLAANEEGKYAVKAESKLEVDEEQGALLSFAGGSLLVAREDGKIQLLESKSLSVQGEFRGERRSQPRFVSAAPGGMRFAIVYQNGKLWVLDVDASKLRRAAVSGQGDIYAASFKSLNRLLVADRTFRVTEYAADSYKRQDRLAPPMPDEQKFYYFGVKPVYFVFPKPGEFGYTMRYALTGTESKTSLAVDMRAPRDSPNPWQPVWNGIFFMIVVLGLACAYIERQEF